MVYTLADLHSVVTIKLILLTGSFRLCHAPLQVKAGDSRGSPAPQTTSLALGTWCSRRPRNPPPPSPPPSTLYLYHFHFSTPITVCGNDYPSPVVATQAVTAAACDAAVVRHHPAFVPPCCCTATSACVLRLSRLLVPICCRLGPRAVVTGDLPPRKALRTSGPVFAHAPLFF